MTRDDGCNERKAQIRFRQKLRVGLVQFHEIVDEVAPLALALRRRVRGMDLSVELKDVRMVAPHSRGAQHEARQQAEHMHQQGPVFECEQLIEHTGGFHADAEFGDLLADQFLAGGLGGHGLADLPFAECVSGATEQLTHAVLDNGAGVTRPDSLSHAKVIGAVHAGNRPRRAPFGLKRLEIIPGSQQQPALAPHPPVEFGAGEHDDLSAREVELVDRPEFLAHLGQELGKIPRPQGA